MNNPNCGACGMLNSRGFCSLTACRFPVVNGLGTWQERILANKPKQTNADKIRSMTDEELEMFLDDVQKYNVCCKPIICDDCADCMTDLCWQCWRAWLKSPAEEGEA